MKKFIVVLSFILTFCFTAPVMSGSIKLPMQPRELPTVYTTENDTTELTARRRHRRRRYRRHHHRPRYRKHRRHRPRYRHHRGRSRGCFIGATQYKVEASGMIPEIILEIPR